MNAHADFLQLVKAGKVRKDLTRKSERKKLALRFT